MKMNIRKVPTWLGIVILIIVVPACVAGVTVLIHNVTPLDVPELPSLIGATSSRLPNRDPYVFRDDRISIRLPGEFVDQTCAELPGGAGWMYSWRHSDLRGMTSHFMLLLSAQEVPQDPLSQGVYFEGSYAGFRTAREQAGSYEIKEGVVEDLEGFRARLIHARHNPTSMETLTWYVFVPARSGAPARSLVFSCLASQRVVLESKMRQILSWIREERAAAQGR